MIKGIKIALIAAGIAVVAAGVAGSLLLKNIVYGKRQTLDEAFNWQKDHTDVSWFEAVKKTEYEISSYDGYQLHMMLCEGEKSGADQDRYVILTHGYTDNRYGTLKYMKFYLERGYSCVIYDLRGHGLNKKTYTSYGVREGKDLNAVIEDTRERYGENIHIGLQGESLGSATSINVLQYKPDVDFVVADCGFSDIWNVLEGGFKMLHLPTAFLSLASGISKIRYGVSLKEMRPIDSLSENEVPIMFIHGAEDTFILPDNSKRMMEATKGYAEYHEISGAAHAESAIVAPEEYRSLVNAFLDHIDF